MLSIINNISSLTAQQNLSNTSMMLNTSLERLSTGYKINSGADGPAALVLSNQQQAQVTGLQSAITNTSTAVSMVQTADGALNEVSSLLDQLRSLALDSANSAVNNPTVLAANQAEVTSALSTIDSIASNTQFGTEKLLDGSLGAVTTYTPHTTAGVTSLLTTGLNSANLAAGNYGIKITTAQVPASAAVAATSTSNITVGTGTAASFFNSASGGVAGTEVSSAAVTGSDYFNESGNIVVGNRSYAYTDAETVSSVLNTINTDANGAFTVNLNSPGQFTVTAKTAGAAGNGVQVQFLGATDSGTLNATTGGADAVTQVGAAGELVDDQGNALSTPINLTAVPGSDGTVLQNTALGIQFNLTASAAQTLGVVGGLNGSGDLSSPVFTVATSGSNAIFQIGANEGQTATIGLNSVATTNLGTNINGNQFTSLNGINVTTSSGAQDSLAVIDAAISQISTQQANLGAFQTNTLQATASNLQTTLENTTSAESTIRDTDFASETSNFTQDQVLMQVGTTVLQNANQTSQLILSLMKNS